MIRTLALLLLLSLPVVPDAHAAPGAPGRDVLAVHDVHVSHTRMVLEGKTVALRIRLFHDDLEKTLQAYSRQADLHLAKDALADSLFEAYARDRLKVELDGRPVALKVSASGLEEDEQYQQVAWYVLEGEGAAPPKKLMLLNGVLFDAFEDQQNLVQLLRSPGDERHTFYFTAKDPRPQTLNFPH